MNRTEVATSVNPSISDVITRCSAGSDAVVVVLTLVELTEAVVEVGKVLVTVRLGVTVWVLEIWVSVKGELVDEVRLVAVVVSVVPMTTSNKGESNRAK